MGRPARIMSVHAKCGEVKLKEVSVSGGLNPCTILFFLGGIEIRAKITWQEKG